MLPRALTRLGVTLAGSSARASASRSPLRGGFSPLPAAFSAAPASRLLSSRNVKNNKGKSGDDASKASKSESADSGDGGEPVGPPRTGKRTGFEKFDRLPKSTAEDPLFPPFTDADRPSPSSSKKSSGKDAEGGASAPESESKSASKSESESESKSESKPDGAGKGKGKGYDPRSESEEEFWKNAQQRLQDNPSKFMSDLFARINDSGGSGGKGPGGRGPKSGGGGPGADPKKPNPGYIVGATLTAAALTMFLLGGDDESSARKITPQEFFDQILPSGRVSLVKVTVSPDGTSPMVVVYLKPAASLATPSEYEVSGDGGGGGGGGGGGQYEMQQQQQLRQLQAVSATAGAGGGGRAAYKFKIGSVERFERKLEAMQAALNVPPQRFARVEYADASNRLGAVATVMSFAVPMALLYYLVRMSRGAGGGGAGGGIFSMGKSKATLVTKEMVGSTNFKDVAGLGEAKVEVMEFVEFLRNPDRFVKLGAKIPKGALLVGPPGTGKTLMARATAGEAGVPFYSISGSDFIEMFVGVGPSRVRDLFAEARKNAPCIVFIDEIDAVGRKRQSGRGMGGNDERENTLNQLLVEMDGFAVSSGVVVLAGTNRVDVLDKALLRPGRFDRQILIDRPDLRGRREIFEVHLKKIKTKDDHPAVAKKMATLTPGMAGADIANVCNEAALLAAREACEHVAMNHFERAIERVIGGLEKKNKVMTAREKEIVAHHEAGHAVCGWYLEHASPLLKVSIVPRGEAALGYAQYLPKEHLIVAREQMLDMMVMTLGGRVAEQIFFDHLSTGAHDDLSKVTRQAYAQVTKYGFSSKIGHVAFDDGEYGQRMYSDDTARTIDAEAKLIIDEAYDRCRKLLEDKKDEMKLVADVLLREEVIDRERVTELLGPRPFAETTDYDDVMDESWNGPEGESDGTSSEGAEKKEGGKNSADTDAEDGGGEGRR